MNAEAILTTQRQDPRAQLVVDAQAGDRQAFGQLVEQFQRAVYATVYHRLGNEAEAQEVCQEVFIQAMRKIGQLRNPRCFPGWIRSMADRMALNRAVRRKNRGAPMSDAIDTVCAEQQTPLTRVLAGECRAQVHDGLGRLSSMDRDTLVAFYFDGRSLVEMSDQFGTPIGTIKRRLHVARKRLARQLAAMA